MTVYTPDPNTRHKLVEGIPARTEWFVRYPSGHLEQYPSADAARRFAAARPDMKVVYRWITDMMEANT